jgi:radical SAM-linked protein
VKIRFRFAKIGKVRWTSHRDVARMWERALRRAEVPLAYSEGFSPRPQCSFGLALPTGCESSAEYIDVTLRSPLELAGLAARLSPLLPEGVDVLAVAELEAGADSLQQEVTSCRWEVEVPGVDPATLSTVLARVLSADSLPVRRERKGREVDDDLRPSVLALTAAGPIADGTQLVAELATRPRGVRPTELAHVLGVPFGLARRTNQWIESDGSRREPLTVDAA